MICWSSELVADETVGLDVVPVDDVDIKEVSPSVSHALPYGVVAQPIRNAAVVAGAEAGGAEALVAAEDAAVGSSHVFEGRRREHPAAAAEHAPGESDAFVALRVVAPFAES